jgi:acetate kinase
MTAALILTINSGSSSIKTSLYRLGDGEKLLIAGQLEGIGRERGVFQMKDGNGQRLHDQELALTDHAAAFTVLFDWLRGQSSAGKVAAVGHRVVHGGERFQAPSRVSAELLADVRRLIPFDPLHLPSEIAAIEAVTKLHPAMPQVACFDTSFHRGLPDVARLFALPRPLAEQGIHRYGFHGLSYEYILEELRAIDPAAAKGRLIIAHLGSGASMSAVRDGRCMDTSMGLSPLGGLVMATRCGDLDPGVILYLLLAQKMPPQDLVRLLNSESGLLGLSGISADMRELIQQRTANPAAGLAIDSFCYQARKFIGAYAAALGGLDALVFTAGIGERSGPVRGHICEGLGFLGVEIDEAANAANAALISTGRVRVRVIPTNEELMIARQTYRLVTV